MRVRVDARAARPAGDPCDAAPVAQAARVVQHLPDRDRRRIVRAARGCTCGPDRRATACRLGKQQHRRRGELLRDRARLEDRVRRGSARRARGPPCHRPSRARCGRSSDTPTAQPGVAVIHAENCASTAVSGTDGQHAQWDAASASAPKKNPRCGMRSGIGFDGSSGFLRERKELQRGGEIRVVARRPALPSSALRPCSSGCHRRSTGRRRASPIDESLGRLDERLDAPRGPQSASRSGVNATRSANAPLRPPRRDSRPRSPRVPSPTSRSPAPRP